MHWEFRDRKETDVLRLICSVSLIAKRSGFSRTKDDDEHEDEPSISEFRLKDRRYLIPRRITQERVPTMRGSRSSSSPSPAHVYH